jgi:hypothetical protein
MSLVELAVADVSAVVAHLLAESTPRISWFRGQGCDQRTLKSSLARKQPAADAAALLASEQRLVTRFRQRSLPLWPEGYPQTDWEHLFAMQHFGVPTRLLDWTESCLAGLFFAADHDAARCECKAGACMPTLWVLDPAQLNAENPRLQGTGMGVLTTTDPLADNWAPGVGETQFGPWPVAVYGTHNSARIVAQQGTFTVDGKEAAALEQSPAVTSSPGTLKKIVIQQSHADLMGQLRTLGVRRASVYPDLPSLASDIAMEELA